MSTKLLLLTDVSGVGGQENCLAGFAKYLDRKNIEASFCTLSGPGWLTEQVETLGIKCYTLGINKGRDYPGGFLRFLKIIDRIRPDIIHTQLRFACLLGAIAGKVKKGVKVLATRTYTQYFGKYAFVDPWAARASDLTVAVSNSIRERLIKNEKVSPEKIKVIYNGIDLSGFQRPSDEKLIRYRQQFGLNNSIVVGIVANIHVAKGHYYLLEAAKRLISRYENVKFLIVGEGVLRKELECFVVENNLNKFVKFTGFQPDLIGMLSIIDIFAHPSLIEGMSISMMEAMAMAKPIVATRVGGIPELVKDKETGILVPPQDSEALAEALSNLLENKETIKKMGQKAKERIRNIFTIEKTVENYEALYEELK